jgi:hypothetical protein
VIEQVPAATLVTVFPATVQTPGGVEAKLTGRPELAVALIGNGGETNKTLLSAPKVIVCGYWIAKVCVTGVAAA